MHGPSTADCEKWKTLQLVLARWLGRSAEFLHIAYQGLIAENLAKFAARNTQVQN